MSFDWKEFLKLACFLNDESGIKCNREAVYRTAVSRAYYAAFCFARNYARDNQGYTPSYDEGDHRNIKEHFRLYDMNNIARWLDDLRVWRNECDYDDEINDREGTLDILVNTAIDRAEKLLRSIQ